LSQRGECERIGRLTLTAAENMQKLLDRGLIYATEDDRYVDFTVPRFEEFMRRHMPFRRPAARTTRPR